jgi:malonate decarboxylase gamma subunit
MNGESRAATRGQIWFEALTGQDGIVPGGPASVRRGDAPLGKEPARFLAVVPDPQNRFPRARDGEVGLQEAWTLASYVRETIDADANGTRRPIIALVDVTSQAYGRREELLGIHLACAAAADAYATARLAGHPVIALLVGRAMSGAFLAHGYQANRILALDDPGVLVHAMGKEAAARVTLRGVAELETLGETILPMSYDIRTYAKLGILHKLIEGVNADAPSAGEVERIRGELLAAASDARFSPNDLRSRLSSAAAQENRAASIEVRRRLTEQWSAT